MTDRLRLVAGTGEARAGVSLVEDWPWYWVASEERALVRMQHPSGPTRTMRVPKGLVHAVHRNTEADALLTVCESPLDALIRFPRLSFTRSSNPGLIRLCRECVTATGQPAAVPRPRLALVTTDRDWSG